MEIGVVVHGPDIVDSGMAHRIIGLLHDLGNVEARMAGTIGKTAVLDAHMEDIIDINTSLKPSECIEEFIRTKDAVFLLNKGKTADTGRMFGSIVVSNLKNKNLKPLIQIESPSKSGGEIIPWNTASLDLAGKMSDMLGTKMSDIPDVATPISIEDHGHRITRKVFGVHTGEKILINGIIVGQAISEDISIITEDGFLTDIKGARVKEHGLEKLHKYDEKKPIDIRKCWIKSGPIRSNNFLVRRHTSALMEKGELSIIDRSSSGTSVSGIKAVIIDHEAEKCFELASGAQVAITVGDDTTEIAGDILYRLKIPIIGITDGDLDGFSHRKHIYPGSVVFRVKEGYDDVVGRMIGSELFQGKNNADFDSITQTKYLVSELIDSYIKFSINY
jgi:hypothetical protein